MPVDHPIRRTYRQFTNGSYAAGGCSGYVMHPKFAQSPEHYVRAFLLIQKDLQEIFDYVEPADVNSDCYSYRIHALLLRACVEVEANCKAILKENGYAKADNWNMGDYKKINTTHRLSSYQIRIPNWTGAKHIRSPFSSWTTGAPLPWYEAYNTTKHDRHSEFHHAKFQHLLDACCGLLIILSAQFGTNDFTSGNTLLALEGPNDGTESAIGGHFRVVFPTDWPNESKYDFDWQTLKREIDPFQTIDYSRIP